MQEMKRTLLEQAQALQLSLSQQTADRLCQFGEAVIRQNEVMNLTTITKPAQVAKLHLLDSLGKRMKWLETVLPELSVEARCITARAEEAVTELRESYDYATSRAVARLNILLELTAPYVKPGGAVLAMKGSAAREELEEAKNAMKKLGLKLEKIHDFTIDGGQHSVIVLRKTGFTPPQYPRRFAKIKQAPL